MSRRRFYWDIRLSERYPTVEFRVADVCATVDEAVMLAGLCRAIAQTAQADHLADNNYPQVRPSVLRSGDVASGSLRVGRRTD